MQALIEWLRQNFYAIWPIARVYSWQLGLRIRGGKISGELEPGLHLRWPFYEEVYKWMTTEVAVELPTGELTTTDGLAVKVSANLAYRTVDVEKMWMTLNSAPETIKCNAFGRLMSTCAGRSWRDLNDGRSHIEELVLIAMRAMAEPWGVEIIRVNLTDLAQPRQYIVSGPPQLGPLLSRVEAA